MDITEYQKRFNEGCDAFGSGLDINACKYPLHSDDSIAWLNGWFASKSVKPVADKDTAEQINALAVSIYADNVAKGFWPQNAQDRNVGEALMLAVSELSEGLEAHRKGLNDDHLPHRKGLEVEIADCIIRLLDLSGGLGLDVGGALVEKLAYNRNRPHKHGKNY